MPFACRVGDSLFIDDSGDGHRYIVISKSNSDDYVICINFTSHVNYPSCPVTFQYRDDHQFVCATVAYYPKADYFSRDFLKTLAESPYSNPYYFSGEIVQKVIEGAFQSLDTPIGVLRELKEQYPQIAEKYPEIDLFTIDNA